MLAGHEQLRGEMRAGYEDLGRQMRMLHEDTLDKIEALAPDHAPLRREFRQADAELKESIERRLDPLEAFVRKQSS